MSHDSLPPNDDADKTTKTVMMQFVHAGRLLPRNTAYDDDEPLDDGSKPTTEPIPDISPVGAPTVVPAPANGLWFGLARSGSRAKWKLVVKGFDKAWVFAELDRLTIKAKHVDKLITQTLPKNATGWNGLGIAKKPRGGK